MATIPEVVAKFNDIDGVEAVVAVGGDGLTISARAGSGIDPDDVAAIVPTLVKAGKSLGDVGQRGEFNCGAFEYDGGVAVVASITSDAMLVVLTSPDTNIGPILYALRRYRSALAGLF